MGLTVRSGCESRPGNSRPRRGADLSVLDFLLLVLSRPKAAALRGVLGF